jgi:hypothetical protein
MFAEFASCGQEACYPQAHGMSAWFVCVRHVWLLCLRHLWFGALFYVFGYRWSQQPKDKTIAVITAPFGWSVVVGFCFVVASDCSLGFAACLVLPAGGCLLVDLLDYLLITVVSQ